MSTTTPESAHDPFGGAPAGAEDQRANDAAEAPRIDRSARLARFAIAAIVLYGAIDLALVFLRPQFSILHNAESDYGSAGSWAWLMDLNFLLRGALSLAVVVALPATQPPARRRRFQVGLVLLAVWAVGSALLAFFPDDPVGTPTHGSGAVHLALAGIAFVGVFGGTIRVTVALRDEPFWAPIAPALRILSFGAVVPLLLLGHAHLRPHSLGGLYEKLFLAVELLWLAAIAVRIMVASTQRKAPV